MNSKNRNVDIPNNRIDSNVSFKNCVKCKKLCSNTCARCGDYYCSRKCQTADWPDHRYVCYKMPNLIMGPPVQNQNHVNGRIDDQRCNNGPQNGFKKTYNSSHPSTSESQAKSITFTDAPKNNDDVILIYVNKANSYYIRTCSSSMEYENNAKDFDRHGRNGERIREIPKRNDVILVKHRGRFVRGLVLKADSEADIEVALVDIGSKAKIPLSDMRVIPDDLYNRKRCNYKLTLENVGVHVESTQWQKLLAFQKNQTVFTIKFEGDAYKDGTNFKLIEKLSESPMEVLLKSAEKESDVVQVAVTSSHQVNESLEVKLETDNCLNVVTAPKIMMKDLQFVTLPKVADLVILDDSTICRGSVSVISKENVEKLDELHARIQDIASTIQEVYEPVEDEICLVLFEDEWYRANYAPPNCKLIDYGNSKCIMKGDIRKLPAELNDPCYTVFCHINGLTAELLKNAKKFLSKYFKTLTVHSDCEVVHCNCDKGENDPNEYDVDFTLIEELLDMSRE